MFLVIGERLGRCLILFEQRPHGLAEGDVWQCDLQRFDGGKFFDVPAKLANKLVIFVVDVQEKGLEWIIPTDNCTGIDSSS